MNRSDTKGTSISGAVVSNAANTRLTGSRLIIARAVWLALVVPSLGLFVVSLPVYFQQLQRACVGPVACSKITGALTAKGLQALTPLGFSASEYAAFLTLFFVVIIIVWCAVGFLIFWRRSDDWFALLAAFFLVMFMTTTYLGSIYALSFTYPALNLPTKIMSLLGLTSFLAFFLLFPNGRLVPRWIGLILLLDIIYAFLSTFPSLTSLFYVNNWPGWIITALSLVLYLVLYGGIIFSQVYRYRHVSIPVERQQTKWVVLSIIIVVIGLFVFSPLFSALSQPDTPYSLIPNLAYPLLLLILPVSVGIAILRYRLYDIDVLINRTLVYGTLTVLLALVYFGLVIGLGSLVRFFTGQVSQSPVVIVVSTLAIAALFQPLRHRIQRFIDRRFYRSKYDAAKTLEAFSATLRNEVDLNQLRAELVAVVEETMHPAHVSLWLRSPQGHTEEPSRKE